MRYKISVIIPCYNGEKYIDRCMESVLNQTLKDIEIIVVDDGSKDKSVDMLTTYSEKDSRVKLFIKDNGGQSSARNLGLDKATGEYIAFVDIDDYIDTAMMELLYNNAIKTNAQMSVCSIANVDANGMVRSADYDEKLVVFDTKTAITQLLAERYILFAMWDKLYKRELFSTARFPEGVIHEDVLLPYELTKECQTICCEMKPMYYYCENEVSTTRKKFTKARLNDITAREKIVSDIKLCYPDLYQNAISVKLTGYLNIIHKLILDGDKSDKPLLQDLIKTVKTDKQLYLNCEYITSKRKLGVRLITGFFPLYRMLYRIMTP